ncbi:hypothetical protein AB9P05_12740 [Roseivirga sp. BDSF3-8]|uniref:hypothetical protein n=1 Tax=Roseivirga sp. BDSF3-8 TaxID=3241598 RepID=UPI003531E4EE
MNEITVEIKDLINKLDQLLKVERFSAYAKIKEHYQIALKLINSDNIPAAKTEISNTIRIFMEAPPADKELGQKILILMDKIYNKINII